MKTPPWQADALQYKVKMYDGMTHGVFFVNNTWHTGMDEEEAPGDETMSYAGFTRGSSTRGSSTVEEESLNTIAKGGLKGIIGLFKEYARNPDECGRSEYRLVQLIDR